jgi:hypothetical protein
MADSGIDSATACTKAASRQRDRQRGQQHPAEQPRGGLRLAAPGMLAEQHRRAVGQSSQQHRQHEQGATGQTHRRDGLRAEPLHHGHVHQRERGGGHGLQADRPAELDDMAPVA